MQSSVSLVTLIRYTESTPCSVAKQTTTGQKMCREGWGTCFNIDLYRDALCKIGNEKCITTIGTVNSRLTHMPAIRTEAQFPSYYRLLLANKD